MRRTLTALALAGTLGLTACGSDEPTEPQALDQDTTTAAGEFDTLDADGDSYLDEDEIAEYANKAAFEPWDADADSEIDRDEIVGNAFWLFDADGDGAVTQAEWEDGATRWLPSGTVIVPVADHDADGDSELDEDEFTEAYDADALGEDWVDVPLDEQEFADRYFELYDADDDGKVTEQEFEAGLDYFSVPADA